MSANSAAFCARVFLFGFFFVGFGEAMFDAGFEESRGAEGGGVEVEPGGMCGWDDGFIAVDRGGVDLFFL